MAPAIEKSQRKTTRGIEIWARSGKGTSTCRNSCLSNIKGKSSWS